MGKKQPSSQNQKIISQKSLVLEFFQAHPKKDIRHPEVVDWVVEEYKKREGKVFRDPDRAIRLLREEGILIKVAKGVYRYEPELANKRKSEDFTAEQKKAILERDGYRCVICGKGLQDGVELHIDHIKPKDLGGQAVIENGQVLCAQHNFLKKNLKQTETGKKMFIRLYELAKHSQNVALQKFCAEILEVFERNNINGHIKWER